VNNLNLLPLVFQYLQSKLPLVGHGASPRCTRQCGVRLVQILGLNVDGGIEARDLADRRTFNCDPSSLIAPAIIATDSNLSTICASNSRD
jgi:hypothetical protein